MSNSVNPFGGKQVPVAVVSELAARKNISTANNQSWFARRTVWVKIISRSEKCGQYKILSSLQRPAYLDGGYNGERPHPVVTSVKVGAIGSLGSIRSATINMIAFTKDQLDELETCYLIPKMSVAVMFGWSVGAATDSSGLPNVPRPVDFNNAVTDTKTTCSIKNAYPLADGFQGRVTKYDVSFNKDGMWWEISVNLVSPSSGVMAAPLEDYTSTCECETVSAESSGGATGSEGGEKKKVVMSAFKTVLRTLCELAAKDKAGSVSLMNGFSAYLPNKDRWKTTLMEDVTGAIFDGGRFIVEKGIQLTNWASDQLGVGTNISTVTANPQRSLEAYLTIDQLCQTWLNYSTSQYPGPDGKKISVYGRFNNRKSGALVLPPGGYLHSSNPHKAIFPGLEPWEIFPPKNVSSVPNCIVDNYVYVGGILVNCIFAYNVLEECGKDATFEDFMSKILVGVNEASGNLWELVITDNGDCDKEDITYSIIDLHAAKKATATEIAISPKSAVVRDISLQLKLTDAMQTQALYAGVKSGMKSSACDDKKFKGELQKYPNEADPKNCTDPVNVNCDQLKELGCKPTPEKNQFREKLAEMYLDTDRPEAMEACYTEQVKMNNGDNSKVTPEHCKNVIMPYDFSFTVDGIGGFEFGQVITSNVLPKRQKEAYVYQITTVEHEITVGDWKTTVSSKPRLNGN